MEKEDIKVIKFKKKYGQNFLINKSIVNKIINLIEEKEDVLIIEIGCGSGNLTKELLNKNYKVIGYEIDKELEEHINKIKTSNLYIIFDDFLKRDLTKDINKIKHKNLIIVGNLPYYITTPIIEKIINSDLQYNQMILMVQKEMGERITAIPSTKSYNSLSVYLNYNFNIRKSFIVTKHNFYPVPNVDSIVLEFKKTNKYKAKNEKLFYKIVRDSFRQKRKTLKNNLIDYDFKIIEEYLSKEGFNQKVRAEQLSIENFIEITEIIDKNS